MFHGYIKLQKGTSLSKVDICKLDLWSTLHIFNDICFWDMMISCGKINENLDFMGI
jgi:hypothetical protein